MKSLTQFKRIRILPLLIAPALVPLAALTPAPAFATPSCGVTTTNLLDPVLFGYFPSGLLDLMCNEHHEYRWGLMLKAKGDSDLYVNQLTWEPGGQAGWHTHPGPSLVTVIEGTLTEYHSDCSFTTHSAGETFTDVACGDIHNVVNETAAEAKVVSVQIVPHGQPRRIDADDPGCPNVPPCPPALPLR
jgi:quercetin dioxygenase-like cupin family protein